MIPIDCILIGLPGAFGPGGRSSAIRKSPVSGRVRITRDGIEGDAHADTEHHGGADQAVHQYAFENYELWRNEFPAQSGLLAQPGFFGENLSARGIGESSLCIGDVVRAGTARMQVSQARQPCWKLSFRMGIADFARRVQETGRTGWFYRVLEPGAVDAGDPLEVLDRPNPTWPLERLLKLLYRTPLDSAELEAAAALAELSSSWKELLRRRLATGRVEDWTRRLTIPTNEE